MFVAKFVKASINPTSLNAIFHASSTGIKSKAQTRIAIILYNNNFQKTEKLATKSFSEFLNIINPPLLNFKTCNY